MEVDILTLIYGARVFVFMGIILLMLVGGIIFAVKSTHNAKENPLTLYTYNITGYLVITTSVAMVCGLFAWFYMRHRQGI